MNIQYGIDSKTGIMGLKFKKNILAPLGDKKEIFEKYILPIISMNDKFVLTGSLSLKLLGIESIDEVGDFDLGISDNFTEEDYNHLINFFQFLPIYGNNYNPEENEVCTKNTFNPKSHIWKFFKEVNPSDDNQLKLISGFNMDVFNDEIIRKKDIITVYYDDFEVRLVHPSVTLSYRMRYALDSRAGTAFKYWKKMDEFMGNAQGYFNNIKAIQSMNMRVQEHNSHIEGNKEKVNDIRNLIIHREFNMDNFFNNVFNKEKLETNVRQPIQLTIFK